MTDPSKELFDDYQKFYESKRLADSSLAEVKALRLPRWLNRVDEDARVLDAGCAEGYLLSLLHESGFHNLSGVDLSLQLVDVARHRLPKSVSITVSDIRDYLTQSPDASFDVRYAPWRAKRGRVVPGKRRARACWRSGEGSERSRSREGDMQSHPKRRRAIVGVVAEGFPTRKFVAAADAGWPGSKSLSRRRVDFWTGMSQKLSRGSDTCGPDPVGGLRGQRYILLAPGGSRGFGLWSWEKMAEIARRTLDRDPALLCVMSGTPVEQALCRRIADVLPEGRCLDLAGKTDPAGFVALIAHARWVLCNYSAAGYIAAVYGVPSVVVLGGGNFGRCYPYPESAPVKRRPVCVWNDMPCFGCNWICRYGGTPTGMPTLASNGSMWKPCGTR